MRRHAWPALVALCTLLAAAPAARANLGPLEPIADAHRALHHSLGLPEPTVVRLLERGVPEPELPAVGLIAHHARVPVARVADLRLSGLPFHDVALRVGVGPEVFYVPYAVDPGPPYGKAWGYYKKHPRARWSAIRLSDAAIIDSSNVLLLNRAYAVPVTRIAELRRGGRSFAAIHHDFYAEKHGKGVAKAAKPGKAKAVHGKAAKSKAVKAKVPKSKASKPPKSHGHGHD